MGGRTEGFARARERIRDVRPDPAWRTLACAGDGWSEASPAEGRQLPAPLTSEGPAEGTSRLRRRSLQASRRGPEAGYHTTGEGTHRPEDLPSMLFQSGPLQEQVSDFWSRANKLCPGLARRQRNPGVATCRIAA